MFSTASAGFPGLTEDALGVVMLAMRVTLGVTLALHGWQKYFSGGRIPGTAGWFDSMGMRPGQVHAYLAASTEIAAGLGLAVGLLTPLAAAGFVGLMVVAGWTVHREHFFIVKGGWEYNMILAVMATSVAVIGPGPYSLDDVIGFEVSSPWARFALSGVLGVVAGAGLLAAAYRPPKADSA